MESSWDLVNQNPKKAKIDTNSNNSIIENWKINFLENEKKISKDIVNIQHYLKKRFFLPICENAMFTLRWTLQSESQCSVWKQENFIIHNKGIKMLIAKIGFFTSEKRFAWDKRENAKSSVFIANGKHFQHAKHRSFFEISNELLISALNRMTV